eukprot:1647585-Lingulodinium_polyedra.AAC.1
MDRARLRLRRSPQRSGGTRQWSNAIPTDPPRWHNAYMGGWERKLGGGRSGPAHRAAARPTG